MTSASSIREKVSQLQGQRKKAERDLKTARRAYTKAFREVSSTEEAQALIQMVAKDTQNQLRYHITELGSMALEAVFGEGVKLDLVFEEKNNRTVANIRFLRGTKEVPMDPMDEDSGGACDIAAFALRCSLWSMKKPRTQAVMVFDEPFKNINDQTREMHKRAADMVKQVSEKLNIQFLIITMLPELENVADRVYEIK